MPVANGPDRISRYEIQGLIARGAMGRVYLARDPNTNRLVVVKLLDATLDSSDVRDRFDREARSLASLSHPNVVHIYDYGDFEDSPFIVMEYVRGETLEEKIRRRAQVPVSDKLRLMSEVCAGLAHAHASGIIHRDVKPANLMVDQDDRLKIIDFGIARVSDSDITRAHSLAGLGQLQIGTPGYMSPEQSRGDEIDLRTDVFSVGAVCYEFLGYREAFPGATPREIESAVMRTPPAPLGAQLPELDREIDEILARALAFDRKDRYQSAGALGEALERCRVRLAPSNPAPPPRRPDPRAPAAVARPVRPPTPVPPTSANRLPNQGARANVPETISVDPTVLIDRASLSAAPDRIEPTMVVQRDDLLRRLTHPDPAPIAPPARPVPPPSNRQARPVAEPTNRQARPVADPTVMVTRQPPRKPASSFGASLQSLWMSIKAPGRRPPSPPRRHSPAKGAAPARGQSEWTRGALIVVAVIAVASLAVLGVIQGARWISPTRHELRLTKPVGGTILGAGLRCGTRGSECSTMLPTGEPVVLQGEADADYVLSGFTGDCDALSGRTAMSQARTCGATFAIAKGPGGPVEWPLTITKPTGGTIIAIGDILCGTLGPSCSANLADGQLVALRFQTDPGHQFLQFTGDCEAKGETTMTAARTCGATFTPAANPGANVVQSSGSVAPRQQPKPSTTGAPVTQASQGANAPGLSPTTSQAQTPQGQTPQGQTQAQTTSPNQTQPTGPPQDPLPIDPNKQPPPPPITKEEHAKKEIEQLIKDYCFEYETRKPERIAKLYPQVNQAVLKDQFRQYKSLKCTLPGPPEYDRLDASPAGSAQIKFGMKQVIEMQSGGAPKTVEYIVTMRLARTDLRSPWLIDNARFELKPKP